MASVAASLVSSVTIYMSVQKFRANNWHTCRYLLFTVEFWELSQCLSPALSQTTESFWGGARLYLKCYKNFVWNWSVEIQRTTTEILKLKRGRNISQPSSLILSYSKITFVYLVIVVYFLQLGSIDWHTENFIAPCLLIAVPVRLTHILIHWLVHFRAGENLNIIPEIDLQGGGALQRNARTHVQLNRKSCQSFDDERASPLPVEPIWTMPWRPPKRPLQRARAHKLSSHSHTVHGWILLIADEPSIYSLDDVVEARGMTATLVCLSEGQPPPRITFHRLSNVSQSTPTEGSTLSSRGPYVAGRAYVRMFNRSNVSSLSPDKFYANVRVVLRQVTLRSAYLHGWIQECIKCLHVECKTAFRCAIWNAAFIHAFSHADHQRVPLCLVGPCLIMWPPRFLSTSCDGNLMGG
jgi:hypothetical protein